MRIVLASASPRRRELLEMLGVTFDVIPAGDECSPEGLPPGRTVELIAQGKAASVCDICGEETLVIAADTLVYAEDRVLGKPKDEDDAFDMLRCLSGREHRVYTGVAVIYEGRKITGFEETSVRFCEMTDEDIRRYIKTGEPMDKAGAYGAQGKGAVFVEGITGDFFNVMGLPLHRLSKMLDEFGLKLI